MLPKDPRSFRLLLNLCSREFLEDARVKNGKYLRGLNLRKGNAEPRIIRLGIYLKAEVWEIMRNFISVWKNFYFPNLLFFFKIIEVFVKKLSEFLIAGVEGIVPIYFHFLCILFSFRNIPHLQIANTYVELHLG